MKRALLLITVFLFSIGSSWAKSKIEKVNFQKLSSKSGRVEIFFSEKPLEIPLLETRNKLVQLEIPESVVWPTIEKKVSVRKYLDGTLSAYQYNKNTVRFRVQLPYSLKGKQDDVSVKMEGKKIILDFPLDLKTASLSKKVSPKINKKISNEALKKSNKYDESFLNKLLDDKKIKEVSAKKNKKNNANLLKEQDQVKVEFSSAKKPLIFNEGKKETAKISLINYVGKFVAFLGLVLLLFFGIVKGIKKGIFKKANIGLLDKAKMVQVINTTYVAPKKSLMIVKVHNQYILLSNTEKELSYLTDIKDWPEMVKDGEKQVNGVNFDSALSGAESKEKDFRLKEVLDVSEGVSSSEMTNNDQKVKFSDQIKTKIKGLKSLQ